VSTVSENSDSANALRKLNIVQQMISTVHPFVWAEKNSPGTISAIDGTNIYNLASDVAHVIAAKHTFDGGGFIKFVDRATLESYKPDRSQAADEGTPKFITTAGVLQSAQTDTPVLRAELWPVPGSDFDGQSISYYYTFKIPDLSLDSHVSLIPGDFHWLILEGMEELERRGPIRSPDGVSQIDLYAIAAANFKRGLAELISRDSAVSSKDWTWENNDPYLSFAAWP
jgi:hypothetical protein